MVTFEVRVGNHDDGEYLGTLEAEALPRIGDGFVIHDLRYQHRKDDALVCTVTDVVWEYVASVKRIGKPVVWIHENSPASKVWCDCQEPDGAKWEHPLDPDEQSYECSDCGHEVAPWRVRSLFMKDDESPF